MKMKKYLGSFLLILTAVVSTSVHASVLSIGVEDMPESIKSKR